MASSRPQMSMQDISKKREQAQQKRLDLAVQTRNFEIELFWKRSLYYWGFIAAAFTGYAALRQQHSDLSVIIACFGTVCSFAWTLVTRGSKYWQEGWESKVDKYEIPVIGPFFSTEEPLQAHKGVWLQARRYSVSKVSIALSDYVFGLWIGVIVAELARNFAPAPWHPLIKQIGVVGFLLLSVAFMIVLSIFGRSSPRPESVQAQIGRHWSATRKCGLAVNQLVKRVKEKWQYSSR